MTKLIVAFRVFTKGPKNGFLRLLYVRYDNNQTGLKVIIRSGTSGIHVAQDRGVLHLYEHRSKPSGYKEKGERLQ